MSPKEHLSKTMRIDLIPDVPADSSGSRVVITTPLQARRKSADKSDEKQGTDYEQLLEGLYDAVLVCDTDGRIVRANARAVEFFMYGRADLVGLPFHGVISGADESLASTVQKHLKNERFVVIQAYCVRKNGTFFPAEIAVNRLAAGKGSLCFFVRDITLRRQAEEMLRTEHYAIQNAGNGIAVADIEAKLEYVNPAVSRMWAYGRTDEVIGMDVRMLLADMDAASQMIGSVMANRTNWTGEMKGLRRNGEEFDLQVSAVCNRNSDGDTIGIVFSFVDISDRKRAEAAMREAERQRVMLESVGAACHHLGQPATVLLANLDIIARRLATQDPEVQELLAASVNATRALAETLHKLNAVNEYRTTPYLNPTDAGGAGRRILEI